MDARDALDGGIGRLSAPAAAEATVPGNDVEKRDREPRLCEAM